MALGALLPDIDDHKSTLGKLFSPISHLLELIFGHRNFFHSLLFVAIGAGIIAIFDQIAGLALAAGFISHLILDALTPQGVRPLWPSSIRIRGPFISGGILDMVLFVLLTVAALIIIF